MSLAENADFWARVRLVARQEAMRAHDGGSVYGEDGIIANGSWNPQSGTVDVWKVETASILTDGTEQPLRYQGVQLATTVNGHQGPPVGGERVILLRRHSGWLAILEHGQDDSPKAPAGEHWYVHPKTGSFQKFENNGNIAVSAEAQHSIAAASSTQTITGSEAHTAQTWSASASTSASVTAPSVQIGPSGGPYLQTGGSGAGGSNALVRAFELNAVVTAINSLIALFNAHVHSGVQGGGGNSGAPTSTDSPISPATGATNATAG